EELRRGAEESTTWRLPRLRPASHVRLPVAVPGRADHLRGGATRTQQANHHAAVVRALDRDRPGAFVDGLAGPKTSKTKPRVAKRGHQLGTKSKSGAPAVTEAPEMIGGPSRTRTLDPLIKSQLLYQLS